jgi:hypothetical protein
MERMWIRDEEVEETDDRIREGIREGTETAT